MTPRQRQIEEAADELITEWRNRVDEDHAITPSDALALGCCVNELEAALMAIYAEDEQKSRMRKLAPELLAAARDVIKTAYESGDPYYHWDVFWRSLARLLAVVSAIDGLPDQEES